MWRKFSVANFVFFVAPYMYTLQSYKRYYVDAVNSSI